MRILMGSLLIGTGLVLTIMAIASLSTRAAWRTSAAERRAIAEHAGDMEQYHESRESDDSLQPPIRAMTAAEVLRGAAIAQLYVSTAMLFGGLTLIAWPRRNRKKTYIPPL